MAPLPGSYTLTIEPKVGNGICMRILLNPHPKPLLQFSYPALVKVLFEPGYAFLRVLVLRIILGSMLGPSYFLKTSMWWHLKKCPYYQSRDWARGILNPIFFLCFDLVLGALHPGSGFRCSLCWGVASNHLHPKLKP